MWHFNIIQLWKRETNDFDGCKKQDLKVEMERHYTLLVAISSNISDHVLHRDRIQNVLKINFLCKSPVYPFAEK